jgi:hypothetical protein
MLARFAQAGSGNPGLDPGEELAATWHARLLRGDPAPAASTGASTEPLEDALSAHAAALGDDVPEWHRLVRRARAEAAAAGAAQGEGAAADGEGSGVATGAPKAGSKKRRERLALLRALRRYATRELGG